MEKVYRLSNHTKYVRGDFCHRIFHILLMGQILLYVPFHQSFHILSFTLQKFKDTNMGDVCGFNYHLVLASMPKPIFPHEVNIWGRWFCWVLDFDGLGQWNSPHALNCQRNSLIVEVPNFWKPMKYPHMFTNHNNLNQQSH